VKQKTKGFVKVMWWRVVQSKGVVCGVPVLPNNTCEGAAVANVMRGKRCPGERCMCLDYGDYSKSPRARVSVVQFPLIGLEPYVEAASRVGIDRGVVKKMLRLHSAVMISPIVAEDVVNPTRAVEDGGGAKVDGGEQMNGGVDDGAAGGRREQGWIFDTVPMDATDPGVLVRMVLLRASVPALNRSKPTKYISVHSTRSHTVCEHVFDTEYSFEDAVTRASLFQATWKPVIQLGHRDCSTHTVALLEALSMDATATEE